MMPLSLIPLPWKIVAALALVGALAGGALSYHHHVFHGGELAQAARDEAKAKEESDLADAERAALNKRIATVQGELNAARTRVAELQKEYDDEKAVSNQRQSDLLAGRERMRVLVHPRPVDPNGSPAGSATGPVDPDADVVVDLVGGAAAAIDQLRVERNEAIRRLEACIVRYDAVKAAADAMP